MPAFALQALLPVMVGIATQQSGRLQLGGCDAFWEQPLACVQRIHGQLALGGLCWGERDGLSCAFFPSLTCLCVCVAVGTAYSTWEDDML